MKYYCLTCGKPTSYTLNLPKFCSECGSPTVEGKFKTPSPDFYKKITEQNTILPDRKSEPSVGASPEAQRIIPVDKMAMAEFFGDTRTVEFDKHLGPAEERAAELLAKIEGGRNRTVREEYEEHAGDGSSEDIDSEYFDTSKFKNIKPKFKIQTFAASKESLEGLITQGYMTNTRPEPTRPIQGQPEISQQQVMEEFRREAGASRQQ